MAPPPVVLLTGGIASGKSLASDSFSQLGITVVDTDRLAREVVAPGQPALREIAEQLGTHFIRPDGSLDRAALRQHIFTHPEARAELEAITHPRIHQLALQRIARAPGPYVLLVVPLYVETERRYPAWKVVVVDVPEAVQLQRLQQRDRLTEAQARAMVAAQASREQRLAVADHILDNNGTPQALLQQVNALHRLLLRQRPSG